MKEHPIIFSTEMVRAILDGKKSQTRRVVKPQPINYLFWSEAFQIWIDNASTTSYHMTTQKCPYGKPGDRLWVRETWAIHPRFKTVLYRADGEAFDDAAGYGKWKPAWSPSIHMPQKYARIWLEITGVRVEGSIKTALCKYP